jgi:L-malate glycosyltransferase
VPVRVLHIDTERGWRGGERQTLWLARELERLGHPSVIAARAGEPLAGRAAELGLRVHHCDPASELDVASAFALRREIARARIDVVHAHTAHAVALGALATLWTRVPLVVARRVDFPLRSNIGTRWKYGRAAAIIAISQAVAAVLERSGVASDRINVIPDGTDLHRVIEPAPASVLESLGVPRGAPVVVQVAQLVSHKDPLNFVRAIAYARFRVPGVQALLVGDGPLRPEVERAIDDLDLADVVHLTGYRADADALLAAASVACLSSREEGMGSVLLDALMLGRPIAATRAGGIPEVIIDGESGLLAPAADSAALGDRIARLLTEPALAAALAANARARAADFSVGAMAERTLEIYHRTLASASRGSPGARTNEARAASSPSETVAP